MGKSKGYSDEELAMEMIEHDYIVNVPPKKRYKIHITAGDGGIVMRHEDFMVECGHCGKEFCYRLTVYRGDLPTCPECAERRSFQYWLPIPAMGTDSRMEVEV